MGNSQSTRLKQKSKCDTLRSDLQNNDNDKAGEALTQWLTNLMKSFSRKYEFFNKILLKVTLIP